MLNAGRKEGRRKLWCSSGNCIDPVRAREKTVSSHRGRFAQYIVTVRIGRKASGVVIASFSVPPNFPYYPITTV